MRQHLLSLLSVLLAAPAAAVDVPVMNPGPQERLAIARAAIAEQGWGRAVLELQTVVQQIPQDADAHNLLGYALRQLQPPRLQLALQHYQQALRLDPAHKGAHEYIGQAYLMLGDLPRARFHLGELERLCNGRTCEEYRDLAAALATAAQGRSSTDAEQPPISAPRWPSTR